MKSCLKISFICAALLLTVCGNAQGEKDITESAQAEGFSGKNLQPVGDLTVITPMGDMSNGGYAVSAQGCYETYTDEGVEWDMHILYTDFETGQRVYLSSSLNADYDTEGDTSFYSEPNSGYSLCTVADKLLVFKNGRDAYNEEISNSTPDCIYVSDLDGKNRKELTVFDGEYELPSSTLISDGTYIYALSNSATSSECYMIRIHMESGEVEQVKDFGNGTFFIMGAYDHNVILKELEAPENVLSAEESFSKQKHVITVLSLDDMSEKEILSWTQNHVIELVDDQYIYYLDKDEPSGLIKLNCDTGEKQTIADLSQIENLNWDGFNTSVILSQIADQNIVLKTYSEDSVETKAYAISASDGKVSNIFNDSGDSSYEKMLPYIIGEWQDQYLVISGQLSISRQMEAPDGSTYEGEYVMSNLALVKKEAYWNGDYELTPIENTFLK